MRKLLSIFVTAALPFAAQAQDAYVIGVSGAMTGPVASNYAPVVEAMKAYLEHVNGRGGINGRKVRVVVLDDQAQPRARRPTRSSCSSRTRWRCCSTSASPRPTRR